jgi:hypothetical protein
MLLLAEVVVNLSWVSRTVAAGALLGAILSCSESTAPVISPRLSLTITPSVGPVSILSGDSAINTCPPHFCIDMFPDPVEPLFGYSAMPRRPLIALYADPQGILAVGTYPVSRSGPTDTTQMIGMELDGPSSFWEAQTGSIRITGVDSQYVTGTIDVDAPALAPFAPTQPDLHIHGSFVAPRQ